MALKWALVEKVTYEWKCIELGCHLRRMFILKGIIHLKNALGIINTEFEDYLKISMYAAKYTY